MSMKAPEEITAEVVGPKAAQLPTKPGSRVMVERGDERCIYILGLNGIWFPIDVEGAWEYQGAGRLEIENWEEYK